MAEPIKIIITQGGEGGSGLSPTSPVGRDTEFGKESSKLNFGFTHKEQMALAGVVLAASRRTIMNSINNNLAMTGNYMQTDQLNAAIQMGTHMVGLGLAGLGIGKAVSAGLMSGPMAGIAIAGIVLNEGLSISQQVREIQIQNSKLNYQADRMRIRAGTSLADGSRGTND